jgi:hypothetical protein
MYDPCLKQEKAHAFLKAVFAGRRFSDDDIGWIVGDTYYVETTDRVPEDASHEQLARLVTDAAPTEEWLADIVRGIIRILGDPVFSLEWDSGAPGAGAGIEQVFKAEGAYFKESMDFGVGGPYDTLEEAIGYADGRVLLNGATRAIHCSEWTHHELICKLDLESHGPPDTIELNGREWELETLRQYQKALMARAV